MKEIHNYTPASGLISPTAASASLLLCQTAARYFLPKIVPGDVVHAYQNVRSNKWLDSSNKEHYGLTVEMETKCISTASLFTWQMSFKTKTLESRAFWHHQLARVKHKMDAIPNPKISGLPLRLPKPSFCWPSPQELLTNAEGEKGK